MKVIYFRHALSEIGCESSGGKAWAARLNASGFLTDELEVISEACTGFPQRNISILIVL